MDSAHSGITNETLSGHTRLGRKSLSQQQRGLHEWSPKSSPVTYAFPILSIYSAISLTPFTMLPPLPPRHRSGWHFISCTFQGLQKVFFCPLGSRFTAAVRVPQEFISPTEPVQWLGSQACLPLMQLKTRRFLNNRNIALRFLEVGRSEGKVYLVSWFI